MVTAFAFFSITMFSAVLYANVEREVLAGETKLNGQLLLQLKTSIEQNQQNINLLCVSAYMSPEAISLINTTTFDYSEISRQILHLRATYQEVNSYVQSIELLNRSTDRYFTTDKGQLVEDAPLNEYMKSWDGTLPQLRPLLREVDTIDPLAPKAWVFSYFLYDIMKPEGTPEGALVVNLRSDWLLGTILAINQVDDSRKDDLIFLVGNDGRFISVGNSDPLLQAKIQEEYIRIIKDNPTESVKTFQTGYDTRRYLISYVSCPSAGWVIIKSQPVNVVYDYINRLKVTVVLITLAFLAVALLISWSISSRIYRPIRTLMEEYIEGDSAPQKGSAAVDEISSIKDALSRYASLIHQYLEERASNRSIMKNYFLRKLLIEGEPSACDDFGQWIADYALGLRCEGPYLLHVLKIDDYRLLAMRSSPLEIDQMKAMVERYAAEAFLGIPSEVIDVIGDHCVLLSNTEGNSVEELRRRVQEMQRRIFEDSRITVTATESEKAEDVKRIAACYAQTLGRSMYSFVSGRQSFIGPSDFTDNESCRILSFSTALARRLSDDIRTGNNGRIEETLGKILNEIAGLQYRNVMLSIMHLVNHISDTMDEINQSRLEPLMIDYGEFQRLLDSTTLSDLQDESMKIIRKFSNRASQLESEKHAILVDAIRKVIHSDYTDPNLSLKKIADMLKMSPVYIGRVFRSEADVSVADALTLTRLGKAADLLRSTSLGVGEVARRVGIENESYFYKLFRKRYGVTPKEFQQKRSLTSH